MIPLSVFIITRNEEVRLPRCLDALVSWADEVLVVDAGSADRTVEIAEAYGVRVIHREWGRLWSAEALCRTALYA